MKRRFKEEVINLNSVNSDLIEESVQIEAKSALEVTENLIDDKFLTIQKNEIKIKYNINFSLIYSFPFLDNSDYNAAIEDINYGIDFLKEDLKEVSEHYKIIKGYFKESNDELKEEKLIDDNKLIKDKKLIDDNKLIKDKLQELYNHLLLTLSLQRNLLASFGELRDIYFGKISITAAAVTMNKNSDELAELSERIMNIVKGYNYSLNKAYENIYYHSSESIMRLVNKIVKATKQLSDNNLDIHHVSYYVPSDYVITLDVKEWTSLYNKIKFVFKKLNYNQDILYNEIKEDFLSFEANYMIILLYEEKMRLEKK